MKDGGTLITMSYYGADKVVNNYNMMGPVKAALRGVGALPGEGAGPAAASASSRCRPARCARAPRAASRHFDELIDMAVKRSPGQRLVDIAEVGRVVAFLAGGASSGMTGDVIYVDAGLHIMA